MTDNILRLANEALAASRRADLLFGERLNRAVRAGCVDEDTHLICAYPECRCKQTPKIVKAALAAWEED